MPRKTRSKRFRKKRSRKNVLKYVGGDKANDSWLELVRIIARFKRENKPNRYILFKGTNTDYGGHHGNFEFIATYEGRDVSKVSTWYNFIITKIVTGYFVIRDLLNELKTGSNAEFSLGNPNHYLATNRHNFFSCLDQWSPREETANVDKSNVVSNTYIADDKKILEIKDIFIREELPAERVENYQLPPQLQGPKGL